MATWAARHAIRGTVSGANPAYSGSSLGLALNASPFGPSMVKKHGGVLSPFCQPTPAEPPIKKSGTKKNIDALVDLPEYQMAVNGELPSVVNRLGNLLDTGQFADVNIRVGKGTGATVFKAHRLLLATASQPLYQLVYTVNPTPSSNDITTIRVTDVDPQAFGTILRYIYTDSVVIKSVKDAFDVMKAGKKWGLKGLGDRSLEYLSSILDDYDPSSDEKKNNLFELLLVAEERGMKELTEKCWGLITRFCNEVIPCEGFLNLNSDLVLQVVSHKDLKMKDHLKFFEAIRDWGVRQVHAKTMSEAELNSVLEKLIKYVDFTQIEDSDMVLSVLPSQCVGKAEIISFFMTRGLEIPKNLEYNNNNNNSKLPFWLSFFTNPDQEKENDASSDTSKNKTKDGVHRLAQMKPGKVDVEMNGSKIEGNKVNRFRKGYLVPKDEITTEHELRFRVDKNIKLLGVGFGFLFSATDMGVTIHCQGPWERVQWTDVMKTYCRVSGEKMQTADVRLMFAAPVKIEADHNYKILVKIGRMSAGNSEVELWGGSGGKLNVTSGDAEFYFINAAVDPKRKPTEAEGDVKNGMITELLYIIDKDVVKPEEPPPPRRRPQEEVEEAEPVEMSPVRSRQYGFEQNEKPKPTYNWMRVPVKEDEEQKPAEVTTTVRTRARNLGSTSEDYSGFGRWRKTSTEDDKTDTRSTTRSRVTAAEETSYSNPYRRRRFDAGSTVASGDTSRKVSDTQNSSSESNVRSRFSTTSTPSTTSDSRPSRDTTRSRFLRDSTLSSLRTRDSSATRPNTYSSSTIRDSSASRPSDYSSTRVRDSSTSRPSDYSSTRIRDSSTSRPSLVDSSATRPSTYTSTRLRDSSASRIRDSSTSRYGSGLSSTFGSGSSYTSKYGTTTSSIGSTYSPSSSRFGSGGASRFSTSYTSFSRYR